MGTGKTNWKARRLLKKDGALAATKVGDGNFEFPEDNKYDDQDEEVGEHVFDRHDIRYMQPSQVVCAVEGSMFTQKGILRALLFKPNDGDVVVACPPRSGEGVVLCMLKLIAMGGEGLDRKGNRTPDVEYQPVPLLEHRSLDEDDSILYEKQDGSFNIYKTFLSHKAVNDKVNGSNAKFITIVRDPKDYRLAFYTHIQRIYEAERNGDTTKPKFSTRFLPDDFAFVKPSFTHGPESETVSYEANILEWAEGKNRHNVHLIFYEDLISAPERVFDELIEFLGGEPLDPNARDRILSHTNFSKMQGHYHAFHEFNSEDTKTAVGAGVKRYARKVNTRLNQEWNLRITSSFPEYRDYSHFYLHNTGREFPYNYTVESAPEEDYLMQDVMDMCGGLCLPRRSGGSSFWRRNKFNSWV